MSDELQLTQPDPDGEHESQTGAGSSTGPGQDKRPRPPIPTIDEAMGQLVQLNAAVMLKMISSKDASLIQRTLKLIIDVHLKRASQQDAGVNQESLAELCKRDPEVVNLITPFLPDAYVDWLMEQIRSDTFGT